MPTPEMKAIPLATANPFPGLRPFREDEAALFFGQEDHVADLVSRVGRKHFVAVLGQSGCGKSSLMNAGLLPRLRRGKVDDGQPRWVIVQTNPGENPLGLLTKELKKAFPKVDVAEELKRDSRALPRIATKAGLHERQKVLIVVDQFEELFRYRRNAASPERHDQADYYVQLLLEAVKDSESPLYIVLAMRTEFLGDCAMFFGLAEQVNEGTYLLPRMSRDQTKEVITGPVQQRGATIAPGLTNQLLNDAEGQEDGLPLLQHALRRIWDHWVARNQPQTEIGLVDYDLQLTEDERKAWPSLLNAHLNRHLNSIYEGLGQRGEDVARGIFRLLSERDNRGRDTRRPVAYEELVAAFPPEQRPEIEPVIEAFRDADLGRTFLVPGKHRALAGSMLDISHECLLRRWDRLRKWLGWEAESRRMFELLADSADSVGWRGPAHSETVAPLEGYQLRVLQEWRERSQPTAGLLGRYRGAEDPALKRCRREFAPAMEYLEWSVQRKAEADEARRQEQLAGERREAELRRQEADSRAARAELVLYQRRQRAMWAWGLGIAAVMGLALAIMQQYDQLQDERRRVETAVNEREKAERLRVTAQRAEAAALRAEKAAQEERDEAETSRLRAEAASRSLELANRRLEIQKDLLNENAVQLAQTAAEARRKTVEVEIERDKAREMAGLLVAKNEELDAKNNELKATNERLEESRKSEEFQRAGNRTQLGLQKASAEPDPEKRMKLTEPLLADFSARARTRKELAPETSDVLRSGLDAISQALQGGQLDRSRNVGAGVTAAAYSPESDAVSLLRVAGVSLQTNGTGIVPLKAYHFGHLLFEPGRQIRTFDVSPGGRYIALGTEGGRITVFERTGAVAEPYRRIMSKRPRWNAAALVHFSRDGQLVVTSAEKGGWTLFDLASKKETAQDEKNGHRLVQAAISGNQRWLAYTTDKQGVMVQSLAERGSVRVLVPEGAAVSKDKRPVEISGDGWVITASAQGALELHASIEQHTKVFAGDARQKVSAAQLSPGEEWLAVAGADGAIALFRWAELKAAVTQGAKQLPGPSVTLRPGKGRESRVIRLTWQPDKTLAALDEAGTLNVWKPVADPKRSELLADVQRMLQEPQLDLDALGLILRRIADEIKKTEVAKR